MLNRRVVVSAYGGPEVLRVIEEPLRETKPNEVLVKVESAGVALADVMRRKGLYPQSPLPPFTPGYDAVGVIQKKGLDVEHYRVGDRVAVFYNGVGGYSQYVFAAEEELVLVPESINAADAAAVILNYITAYQMLHRLAKVEKGNTILIHGASGGVGTALLDLGRSAGLKMFGTASSKKHDVVSSYGAIPIDYKTQDFVEEMRRLAPEGVDAVFDPIGGENWNRSLLTLHPSGTFVGYGYTSVLDSATTENWMKDWSDLSSRKTVKDGPNIHMYSVTSLKKERLDWFKEDLGHIFSLLLAGAISPLISHRISLFNVIEAHALLEHAQSSGKIILTV